MAGVYISYPFCAQKCSFCNFASGVSPLDTRVRYRNVLLDEIRAHSWGWLPETLYFGGGTPSLMPVELLREVMSLIPGKQLTEVTLECAPGTITPERARAWKNAGVTRVSLGVQSFVTAELRQTGRRHDAIAVQHDIETLRDTGIHNINIDLIAGLPHQTEQSWEESLEWMAYLNAPHASVYILELDEDSRLGKEVLSGGLRYGANGLPGDDLTAQLYERAVERFAEIGLIRYEISNFARGDSQSRHNLKYWQLKPYMGFGLDAHSFDGSRRWANSDDMETYLANCGNRAGLLSDVSSADASEEHFFVGLRLMRGIEPTEDEWSRFAAPVEKWTRAGMLEREGNRLRLSDRGVLLSNEIFQEFLDV